MSKRFGRNQKRKMREQIAHLEKKAIEGDWWRTESLSLESRLVNWARSMNSYLGSDHPLNERIHKITLQRVPYLEERLRFNKPLTLQKAMDINLSDFSTACEYIDTVLHVVNVHRDKVSHSVRVELLSPDQRSYFAIDESELKNGRRDPRFIHWMSEEIASRLSEHVSQ